MTSVTVTRAGFETTIRTRPEAKAVLLFVPYFLILVGVVIGTGLSLWLVWFDLTHRVKPEVATLAMIGGLIYLVKGIFPARLIYRYLGSRSTLKLGGGPLEQSLLRVQIARIWTRRERCYPASAVEDVRWEGRRGQFRLGKVVALMGEKKVVLAGGINDRDGERLVEALKAVWPTPPAPHWM